MNTYELEKIKLHHTAMVKGLAEAQALLATDTLKKLSQLSGEDITEKQAVRLNSILASHAEIAGQISARCNELVREVECAAALIERQNTYKESPPIGGTPRLVRDNKPCHQTPNQHQ